MVILNRKRWIYYDVMQGFIAQKIMAMSPYFPENMGPVVVQHAKVDTDLGEEEKMAEQ